MEGNRSVPNFEQVFLPVDQIKTEGEDDPATLDDQQDPTSAGSDVLKEERLSQNAVGSKDNSSWAVPSNVVSSIPNASSLIGSNNKTSQPISSQPAPTSIRRPRKQDASNITKHSRPMPSELADKQHPCPECGKIFPRPSKLKRHQMSHKVIHKRPSRKKVKIIKDYICSQCNKKYSSASNLSKHMLLHSDVRPFTCPHCSKGFTQNAILRRHVSQVHLQIKNFPCEHCGKQFYDSHLRNRHIETVHNPAKAFVCNFCSRMFDRKSNLKIHLLSVHYNINEILPLGEVMTELDNSQSNKKPEHICNICHKQYSSANSLKKHVLLHSDVKPFICPHCHKGFTFNAKYKRHLAQVHLKERNFSCSQCEKQFYDFHQMYTHISTVHKNIKAFVCTYCSKQYAHKANLETHIHSKHYNAIIKEAIDDISKDKIIAHKFPYRCQNCYKMFKKESKLYHHIAVVHNKEKPHVCEICKESFGFKSKLKFHVQTEHTSKNKLGLYECQFCDKKFKFKSLFLRHNSGVHSDERNDICIHCGKGFATPNHLKTHISIVHEEKRHKCRICEKSFTFESVRELHEFEVHKFQLNPGDDRCNECGRYFNGVDKLEAHKVSKHSKYECDICKAILSSKTLMQRHILHVHLKTKLTLHVTDL